MIKKLLVKLFSFRFMLIEGFPVVIDRWSWLKKRLPPTDKNLRLLDVGCGNGAFTIGLALKGYNPLGISWDESDINAASEKAKICKANNAKFEVQDIRFLDERKDLIGSFDVAVCLECIEHIRNDQKLITDMTNCLKPNAKLMLTTCNKNAIPIGGGGLSITEDGGHIRIGYTEHELRSLCKYSGLRVDEISYCSGFLSQKLTALQMFLSRINPCLSWCIVLPLRIIPLLFDKFISKLLRWKEHSICLVAHKKG